MSNVKEREGFPLMEKPQPVPGPEPGLQPPPYSSLFGSQSQEYTPVSAVPTAPMDPPDPTPMPMPMSMPMPQDTATCYNPVNQGLPENGIPMPQPAYNPTYVSTTYDPMANVQPVNQDWTHNQTVLGPSQLADIRRRAGRCRCLTVGLLIGVITIAVGVGIHFYKVKQVDKAAKIREELMRMQRERDDLIRKQKEAFDLELFNRAVDNMPRWQSEYLNRYQRMVHQDLNDYHIPDSNHPTVSDESIKLEKSNRQRRDLRGKKRFDDKKIQRSIRKKRLYKVKKYVR